VSAPAIITPRDASASVQQAIDNIRTRLDTIDASSSSSTNITAQLSPIKSQLATLQSIVNALQKASSGASTSTSYQAALSVAGFVPVYISLTGNVMPADPMVAGSGDTLIGITLGPANPGTQVSVATDGDMVNNPNWSWTPLAPIFVGPSSLTQTAPSAGYVRRVGYATSATDMLVSIGELINQSGQSADLALTLISGELALASINSTTYSLDGGTPASFSPYLFNADGGHP
jgi:hypothetical protein